MVSKRLEFPELQSRNINLDYFHQHQSEDKEFNWGDNLLSNERLTKEV